VTESESLALRVDLGEAVAALPEFERRVCECLSKGFSVEEAAEKLGCRWHTVKAAVQRIQDRLRAKRLNEYLDE
jgi:DNA-binding NarL/FixJ family response regulator